MKVILHQNVSNLGVAGAIVKVTAGYGRNYLIPKGFATQASEDNVKQLEHDKHQIFLKQAKEKKEAILLSKQLETTSVTLARKTGEEDRIFGSITTRDISEALREEGHKIHRRQITLNENIKTTGTYEVQVKLHNEVSVPLKVWVVKEN